MPQQMVPLFCRENHPPRPTSGLVPAFAFRSPSHDHPARPPLAKKKLVQGQAIFSTRYLALGV
jgi:hypothetical protein